MNVIVVIGLFVLGFFVMAAGGVTGSAVHQMPSIAMSVAGCVISTIGLGTVLSSTAIAKSKLAMRVAEVLSFVAILYGFFH